MLTETVNIKLPSRSQFIAHSQALHSKLCYRNSVKNLPFDKELWWTQWFSDSLGTEKPQLPLDSQIKVFLHECAHLVQAQRQGKDVTDSHFGLSKLIAKKENFSRTFKWEVEVFVYEKALAEKYNRARELSINDTEELLICALRTRASKLEE